MLEDTLNRMNTSKWSYNCFNQRRPRNATKMSPGALCHVLPGLSWVVFLQHGRVQRSAGWATAIATKGSTESATMFGSRCLSRGRPKNRRRPPLLALALAKWCHQYKPASAVWGGVSTFVGLKPPDTFNEMLEHFPATFVVSEHCKLKHAVFAWP